VILPDVNVLVHAHNIDSAAHQRARHWWDACLAGPEGVGLAWVTLLGFIRITTNPRIVARPLPVADVTARIQSWLDLPHVHVVQPSDAHFTRLRTELERLGVAGNLTTDAHLAVLAMERGYVLHSTDTDFGRFPGLRWVNPCDERSSSLVRD
jgi:toxin-antitoxin system PIN domain toxin